MNADAALSLMVQFGSFVVALLTFVLALVLALLKRK
ncbi:MAG: putative holin-like toxin [Alicyclobacillus sp.]|nr:putative holin-like toxin [Alicyclobacillus sp.]